MVGKHSKCKDWSKEATVVASETAHEEIEAREEVDEGEMVDRLEKFVGLRGTGNSGQSGKRPGGGGGSSNRKKAKY